MIYRVHQPPRRLPPPATPYSPRTCADRARICRTSLQQLPAGAVMVSVHGDVDAYTVELLTDRLAVLDLAALPVLVIDLREVSFLGVAGLQVLDELLTTTRSHRTPVRLVSATRPVLRALQVGGLTWALARTDDPAECAHTRGQLSLTG